MEEGFRARFAWAGAHAGNIKREAEDGRVESPRNRMDSIRIRLRTDAGGRPWRKGNGRRCRHMRMRVRLGSCEEPAPFGRGKVKWIRVKPCLIADLP